MSFRKAVSTHSTEYAPFHLMFGEDMRLPFDVDLIPRDNLGRDTKQYLEDLLENVKISAEIARDNDIFHQERNKEYHDRSLRIPDFKLGDRVMMAIHQIPKGQTAKLYDKATGPYRIIKIGPNYTYQLERVADRKVHPSYINATHLKHYYDPDVYRAPLDDPQPNQNPDDSSDQPSQHSSPANSQDLPPPALTNNDNVPNPPNLPLPAIPDPDLTLPPTQNSQPSQRTWNIQSMPYAKFKNNKRLIRVVWEDGSRTWEPDESFDKKILDDINRRFTKHGKRKKTYFVKKNTQQSQA